MRNSISYGGSPGRVFTCSVGCTSGTWSLENTELMLSFRGCVEESKEP